MSPEPAPAILDLPVAGMLPLVIAAVIGLMMWGAGPRLMKVSVACLGLLSGGVIGWGVTELLPDDMQLPGWALILVVAVATACLAVVAYRLVVTVVLAGLLALLVPLGARALAMERPDLFGLDTPALAVERGDEPGPAAVVIDPDAPTPVSPDAPDNDVLDDWIDSLEETLNATAEDARDDAVATGVDDLRDRLGLDEATTDEALSRAGDVVDTVRTRAVETWDETPDRIRPLLLALAVAAGLAGIMLGALAPTFSTAIVTALGGSLLWMTCGLALLGQTDLPPVPWLPTTATAGLIWWIAVALIGLIIQWTLRPKPADTSA